MTTGRKYLSAVGTRTDGSLFKVSSSVLSSQDSVVQSRVKSYPGVNLANLGLKFNLRVIRITRS